MSYTINGTCSICGGAVTTPTFWWSVVPPTPSCSQCGAVPMRAHGPVIPMQPAPRYRTVTSTSAQDIQEAIDKYNVTGPKTPVGIPSQRGMSTLTATADVKVWPVLARTIAQQHDTTASVRHELRLSCDATTERVQVRTIPSVPRQFADVNTASSATAEGAEA